MITIEKLASNIFNKWNSYFTSNKKAMDNIENEFDSLFGDFYSNEIPFDIATDYLSLAIKAALPSTKTVKSLYMNRHIAQYGTTELEWADEWKEKIKKKATQIFYEYYTTDGKRKNHTEEEEMVGSLSKEDYDKSMRYINSIPTLPKINPMSILIDADPEELERYITQLEKEIEDEKREKNNA